MTGRRKAGLLLAAGHASRMGKFKPLLPLGGEVILERGVRLFREAGVEDVRVVVGHRSAEVIELLEKHKVRWVRNDDHLSGMFSSVRAGAASLEEDIDAFFVLPADVPLVRPQTLRDMLEGYRAGSCEIVFPVFGGSRGHPVLLSTSLVPGIMSWKGEGGLRSFLDVCGFRSMDLEVADRNVLFDVDTPADYQELLRRDQGSGIPSVRERKGLLTRKRTIYLLRHGEIDLAGGKRLIGQADVPLNETGFRQAWWWRRELSPVGFDRCYCSDLLRSRQTAEALEGLARHPVEVLPRLREIHLGAWDGLSRAEIDSRFPGQWEERGRDLASFRPPGGESFSDLSGRVLPVFEWIRERPGGNALVLAHAGVNRVILCRVLGMPLANMFRLGQGFGALCILDCSQEEPRLEALRLPPRTGF